MQHQLWRLVAPVVDVVGAVQVGRDGERVEHTLGRVRVAGVRVDHLGVARTHGTQLGFTLVAHAARTAGRPVQTAVCVATAAAAAVAVVPPDGAVLAGSAGVAGLARALAAVARAVVGAELAVDADARGVVTGAHLPSGPTSLLAGRPAVAGAERRRQRHTAGAGRTSSTAPAACVIAVATFRAVGVLSAVVRQIDGVH